MNTKELQKTILNFFKPYQKSMSEVIHYLPPGPIVYFIFDVALPLKFRGKEYQKLKDEKIDFQIIFSGLPGTQKWALFIDNGTVAIRRGEIDYPHTVINAEARTFVDTITGRVAPEQALMAGKLTLTGIVTKMKIFESLMK